MFKFFANIFGYVLNFVYNIVNNYGLAIIIFTILLRLILLPINLKQQKTMKKTAKLQEKLKELQDKYSNDPVRFNEEVRNLYTEENMNPFSGCLGSILQIVIVVAMFILVSNPLTYMKHISNETLYGKDNKGGYKAELEDSNVNYTEIAMIKQLGNKHKDINLNMNFLGLDLGDIPTKDYSNPKVFIIPILYVITSIVSMKITTSLTSKRNKKEEVISSEANEKLKNEEKLIKVENNKDEMDAMESMNKTMSYMMPIMTVSIALIAPLGLALYWFISNLLMILERLIVDKTVKE